jgi:UDP-N-acetylglucosamine 2-epimerase (non-hydrolysing)
MKVLCVIGTRPEAIKLYPLVRGMEEDPERFEVTTCLTAQHRELITPIIDDLGLRCDHWLDTLSSGQTLVALASKILAGLDRLLEKSRPDWLVVQGDTTTAFAAALAGNYLRIPVAHVEAGLRSYDRSQPFPEEANRRMASVLADLHLAPSAAARANLLREGIPGDDIVVTGNTVLDALRIVAARPPSELVRKIKTDVGPRGRIVLVTAHRRENIGEPLRGICSAIAKLASYYKDDVRFLLPIHLNPAVKETIESELSNRPGVTLLPPLSYSDLVGLLAASTLVLTDSGGLQEEAPYLKKPCLVLRERTERPEGIASGNACLVGTSPERIVAVTTRLLEDPGSRAPMESAPCPYGDGHAVERIIAALCARFEPAGAAK